MAKTKTLDEVLSEFYSVHGLKYDYSKVQYVNTYTKVCIICKTHGEFWQQPRAHLAGQQCPKCTQHKNWKPASSAAEFEQLANQIHGHAYTYSDYVSNSAMVTINCPIHGPFRQRASSHLRGKGCPKCAGNSKKDVSTFVAQAKKVHGDVYDYSLVNYVNAKSDITIICKEHGSFKQRPSNHLSGKGCKLCGLSRMRKTLTYATSDFMALARKMHSDKYDYSKDEDDLAKYIGSMVHITRHERTIIKPYEIDLFVPSKRLGIEYHGCYHHSYNHVESASERQRHKLKADLAKRANIKLLQFYSYEWHTKRTLIESMIKHHLGLSTKIYARRCQLRIPTKHEIYQFFEHNHLAGGRHGKIDIGLYHEDKLVAAMNFIEVMSGTLEIMRYATVAGSTVVGGLSKMLKWVDSNVAYQSIMTYADRRISTGNCYRAVGFVEVKETQPGYQYVLRDKPAGSRQKFQKRKLRSILPNFDESKTEAENMFAHGYRRLWDAGHIKLVRERDPSRSPCI